VNPLSDNIENENIVTGVAHLCFSEDGSWFQVRIHSWKIFKKNEKFESYGLKKRHKNAFRGKGQNYENHNVENQKEHRKIWR
jgi:hypothetical protein